MITHWWFWAEGRASWRQQSPTFLAPGTCFMEDNFSMNWLGDGFGMIQAHYICCALYFYIITSAPPQIIRHYIPDVGDPSPRTWALNIRKRPCRGQGCLERESSLPLLPGTPTCRTQTSSCCQWQGGRSPPTCSGSPGSPCSQGPRLGLASSWRAGQVILEA